jgi:hypothetical protein
MTTPYSTITVERQTRHPGGEAKNEPWDLLHILSHDPLQHKAALASAKVKFWQIWIDGVLGEVGTEGFVPFAAVLYKPSGALAAWVDPIYRS